MAGQSFIIMGVSGCGKTSIGMRLAQARGAKLIDGDDLHPRRNIDKMAQGIPLCDDDRWPWLERLSDAAYSLIHKNETGFIVCSALKKSYRDFLRRDNPQLQFIWLKGDYSLILSRLQQRAGHYMPTALLESQFAALEVPTPDEQDVLTVEIDGEPDQVVERCLQVIRQHSLS